MTEEQAEFFENLRGKRGGARNEETHRGANLAGLLDGGVEQADVDGWNAEEERRTEVEKFGGGSLMLEAFKQAHATSADEPAMEAVTKAVDVEEREGEQESISAGDLPAGGEVQGVRGEVIVREHCAFGSAGGSGGIDDAGGSIAIQMDARAFVGKRGGFACEIRGIPNGNRACEFAGGDDGGGVGVGEDVRDLAVAIKDVEGNEDNAEFDAGQVEVDHLDTVGEINAKPVAGVEAAPVEQLSEAIAAGVDITEGVGGALILERGRVAAAEEGEVE